MTDDEKAQACADAFKPLADAATALAKAAKLQVFMINRVGDCEACGQETGFYAFSTFEKASEWLDKQPWDARKNYRIETYEVH